MKISKVVKVLVCMSLGIIIGYNAFAKEPKVITATPVTLDWQGRETNSEIPEWAKAVSENNKRKIVKELDLSDYQVFVFNSRGKNLEFLETWTDKVELQSNVAQSISSEIGRATQAALQAEQVGGQTEMNKTLTDVTTVLSNVRVNGLERMASCWIKTGISKVKKPKTMADYDITYSYYSVWALPKKSYQAQLDAAMTNLPQNTIQDPLLMKMITRAIEKVVLGDEEGPIISADVEE